MKMMSHRNGDNRDSFRFLGLALVMAVGLGFAINGQANTCTTANWSDRVGLSLEDDTGLQAAEPGQYRRYFGPCSVNVQADATPRYLIDQLPSQEQNYVVRFHAYFGDLDGSGEVVIFRAVDAADEVKFELTYDSGTLVFDVANSNAVDAMAVAIDDPGMWQVIEIVWESGDNADVRLALNTTDPANDLVFDPLPNTSGTIDEVQLGDIDGAGIGGALHFDEFDSRRSTRPSQDDPPSYIVGDANNDGVIDGGDNIVLLIERLSPDPTPAPGMVDCNEDGVIDGGDNICLLLLRFSQ